MFGRQRLRAALRSVYQLAGEPIDRAFSRQQARSRTVEEQPWVSVLSNLGNLTQEWPKASLRVVVDGSAVSRLASDNDLSVHLAQLAG